MRPIARPYLESNSTGYNARSTSVEAGQNLWRLTKHASPILVLISASLLHPFVPRQTRHLAP